MGYHGGRPWTPHDTVERRSRRLLSGGLGLAVSAGVAVLGLIVAQVNAPTKAIAAHQDTLNQQVDTVWGDPVLVKPKPGTPPPGYAIARVWVPRLDMHWVAVEGVAAADIANAPGHYPGTAMPGQKGNFSLAGHRTPAIWWDLEKVRPGDVVVVETADRWYIYKVTVNKVVPYSTDAEKVAATNEIAPVPPSFHSGQRIVTLTTCNPKVDNYERLIVHAVWQRTVLRKNGPPPEVLRG
jgi:sortase A